MKLNFRPTFSGFLAELFGEDWPQWVKELRGKSGIYVIRSKESGAILYVGESHSGRLKKTLLRHFQAWSGKTAGNTYSRSAVEIAVISTPPAKAVPLQNRLIVQLQPRDNKLSPAGSISHDDNPF